MKNDHGHHQPADLKQHVSSGNTTNVTPPAEKNLFCYEIANFRILIEPTIKMEVLETSIIYPIPNSPKHYLGVTSLRGEILPIANLHFLLGLQESNTKKRLLKLEHPDFPSLIIAIDNLPYQSDVARLRADEKENQSQLPLWVSSSSSQQHLTFLFTDHASLFKQLQDESPI